MISGSISNRYLNDRDSRSLIRLNARNDDSSVFRHSDVHVDEGKSLNSVARVLCAERPRNRPNFVIFGLRSAAFSTFGLNEADS